MGLLETRVITFFRPPFVYLNLLLVTGLLLAACSGKGVVHQANPETRELVIKAWANEGSSTWLTVTTVDGDFSDFASNFTWYYDVPANQVEYLVKSGDYRDIDLHLHQNKAHQK